jgi:hypothetical protein
VSDEVKKIIVGRAKKARTLESTRKQAIIRYLNAVPGCRVDIRSQTGFGKKGGADLLGCINGRHFELEVKQPGQKPTILQQKWLDDWMECGAVVGRVEDVESTRAIFRKFGLEI